MYQIPPNHYRTTTQLPQTTLSCSLRPDQGCSRGSQGCRGKSLPYLQLAKRLWGQLTSPWEKGLPLPHNAYLKLFALQRPTILDKHGQPYDAILIDEAQVGRQRAVGHGCRAW